MSALDISLIGGALLVYALLSRRLAGTSITAPMVFVTVGFSSSGSSMELMK